MPSLLLAKPDPFDVAAVAHVLADFQKIPFIDAVHIAKQGWGILAEKIDEEKAVQLKNVFFIAGIETRIVADPLLSVPPPQTLGGITFEASQLICTLRSGAPLRMAAAEMSLITACALDENRTVKVTQHEGPSTGQRLASGAILLATGIPIRIGPKKKTVETKQNVSETFYYLDLYPSGALRHLRVEGSQFDYSCLGPKKQYNVAANFKMLVKACAICAPQAKQGRGTQILIQDKSLSEMGYRSLEDLDHESRWLLSLP